MIVNPPWPTGRIAVDPRGDGAVLRLTGEIDAAVVEHFRRSHPIPSATITVVDVENVTFLSSSGIGLLVGLTEPLRRSGRRPLLQGSSRAVDLVLRVTGVDTLFQR